MSSNDLYLNIIFNGFRILTTNDCVPSPRSPPSFYVNFHDHFYRFRPSSHPTTCPILFDLFSFVFPTIDITLSPRYRYVRTRFILMRLDFRVLLRRNSKIVHH